MKNKDIIDNSTLDVKSQCFWIRPLLTGVMSNQALSIGGLYLHCEPRRENSDS
ncbi:MAG: hypothetical protein JW963_26545 [Anaerolineales bacterium]|nr:hypothetical protein [Anaerolineales bacterium]